MTLWLGFCGLAGAGAPTVSAAGGLDYLTANPWAGLDVALHPTGAKPWEPVGRITPTWGLKDETVLLFTEVGIVRTIPNDQATIRAGLVFRTTSFVGSYVLPIQPAGIPSANGSPHWGLVPSGYALLEFDMGSLSPFTIGFHVGAGSAATDYGCVEGSDPSYCLFWTPAFTGGFVTRYRHKSGFVVDARFGPAARLSLGWAFGKPWVKQTTAPRITITSKEHAMVQAALNILPELDTVW